MNKEKLPFLKISVYLQPLKILRGRAEVARWAHNPKVVGSNPAPATKKAPGKGLLLFIYDLTFRTI